MKKVTHLYPTTQPAEGGLLQPRVIPKELRQFVQVNVLAEPGASGFTARLKPTTFEGLKETSALSCHAFAMANFRISNNLKIGAEVCGALIEQSKSQLEVF